MTGPESARVKVAVLSFAHGHAVGYVRYLKSRGDVEVIACDPDGVRSPDVGPRGLELASQLGVGYLDSVEEALAWGPDAVVVCSENIKHRELVEQAAAAGAQILCEKPLATTAADAAAMLDAVERAGVALMVAYPVRFSPSFEDRRRRCRRADWAMFSPSWERTTARSRCLIAFGSPIPRFPEAAVSSTTLCIVLTCSIRSSSNPPRRCVRCPIGYCTPRAASRLRPVVW